ncbi:hypothetical protein Np050604_101 [Cyanophage S-RIM44]|uniref:Uncharacterized protein n=2 Tax=Vellamovirus TaxID=2733139 RepID=A0A127KMW9_9CAUD|nr:hypothetical protein Syn1_102 [Prochlorococcus phage Syn1]AMO43345.1 hypothetical protein W270710_101 [Cyanophage S-RIM44]ADO99203.1 hypothetical protein Syn1_102 [Prochlorococcus phage Syn1]AOO11817.1 hypothetical protein Np050604_101 [Cyanophage S-RIM44]AOO12518.1 hypothetical protein Sn080709_101 [Cyanophage S-RIM44]AOO12984.1 hypothetical protein W2100709_102 [Cyanophage S-RIM44]
MSELRVNSIRSVSGSSSIAVGNDGSLNVPGGLTVAGKDVSGGGLDSGPTSERPTAAPNVIRWNTSTEVLETYFPFSTNQSDPGWVAVGGRNLLARVIRSDAWSSCDIRWGQADSRNSKYYGYEIEATFFEPSSANRNMYARWIRGDSSVDTGNNYRWSYEWIHSNDGISRHNARPTTYFPISTSNNGSYQLRSNGEATLRTSIKMSNCPNSSAAERWSFTVHSGGDSEQDGFYMVGGGVWRCPYRRDNNAYPLNGIRFYLSGGTMRGTTGPNTIISVFGISGYETENMGYVTVG